MHLDKIYTKTGDQGKTSLVTGERVAKGNLRIEVFGTIDELNSVVGLVRTCAGEMANGDVRSHSEEHLQQIQNDLFDIGAILACAPGRAGAVLSEFPARQTILLEALIDHCQAQLDDLRSFVLPGGSLVNAYAHLARAVCRRAERLLWRLHAEEPVAESILTYVNRLSDYLFVYSRWVLRLEGKAEFLWKPGGKPEKRE